MANYNSSHTGAEIDSAIGRVKDTAVTAGTVSASLGVVVDANKDISGFRNVTLTGQLQAATINLTGDTTIGDGDTDNITINADVNSNIIPNTDNTFDLGSASKQWKDLYVNGIGYIDQLGTDADPIAIYASSGEIDGTAIGSESASTGAFTTISASGNVDFNGDLDVDGTTNLDVVDIDGAFTQDGGAVVFNEDSGDYDFRVESNGNANMIFVDGGNNRVGVGTNSVSSDSAFGVSGSMELIGASNRYYIPRASDGALTGSIYSRTGNNVTISGAGSSSGQIEFIPSSANSSAIAMTIDSSQRVGIGLTSPTTKLHLSDGASTAVIAKFTNDTTGNTINDGSSIGIDGDGDLLIYNVENKEIKFYTNDTLRAVIDNGGNVGIGVTSPAYKLDLASSEAIVSQFTGSSGETILSLDNTSTNGDKWYLISGGSGGSFSGGKFGIYNADTTTAVATFTNGGNVGIGDTSPAQKLSIDVNSSNTTQASFDGIEIGNSNTTANNGAAISFSYGAGGNSGSRIGAIFSDRTGNSEDTDLFFGTLGSGGYVERMRITSGGDVGIGDTSPSTALTNFGSASRGLSIRNGQPTIALTDTDTGSGALYIANGGGISYFQNTVSGSTMRFYVESLLALEIENDGVLKSTDGIEFTGSALGGSQTGVSSSGSGGNLRFYINGTEKVSCRAGTTVNDGNVHIDNGSQSQPAKLVLKNTGSSGYTGADVRCYTDNANRGAGMYTHNTGASNEWFFGHRYQGWDRWSICYESQSSFAESVAESPHEILHVTTSGAAYNDANTWGSSSDERIKHSIVDANSQWDDIKALKIKNYKFIKHGDNAESLIGVIAQDLEISGMNGLVDENPADEIQVEMYDRINEGDNIKTVKYSVLYMKAVKALQEAMAKIETLEAKVEALENA